MGKDGVIMALEKIMINDLGLQTKYHRIAAIQYNHGQVLVTIESYTDDDYRNKEALYMDLIKEINQLSNRLRELDPNSENEEERQEYIEKNARMLEITNLLETMKESYALETRDFVFDVTDEEISFSNIYERLKASGQPFEGAIDV